MSVDAEKGRCVISSQANFWAVDCKETEPLSVTVEGQLVNELSPFILLFYLSLSLSSN